jgi:hypothetical protein
MCLDDGASNAQHMRVRASVDNPKLPGGHVPGRERIVDATVLEIVPLIAMICAWAMAVAIQVPDSGWLFLLLLVFLPFTCASGLGWILVGRKSLGFILLASRCVGVMFLSWLLYASLVYVGCERRDCHSPPSDAAYFIAIVIVIGPLISAIALAVTQRTSPASPP